MARAVLYVADKQPSLPTIVKDSLGAVVNLTGYTGVTFSFRQAYDSANKFSASGVIVSAAAGSIRYDLGATDLAGLTPGVYVGQWTLLDATSKPQHVDAGQFEVRSGY